QARGSGDHRRWRSFFPLASKRWADRRRGQGGDGESACWLDRNSRLGRAGVALVNEVCLSVNQLCPLVNELCPLVNELCSLMKFNVCAVVSCRSCHIFVFIRVPHEGLNQ